ncbi:MAG: M14 family metallopeptidase [Clostridia bacterium]|nr:M14 family metallopeptidase [Clostridia bacterium]
MMFISMGSAGPWVSLLQSTLNRGYNAKLHVDGTFGPLTAEAVKGVQTKLGHNATGRADENLWNSIMPAVLGVSTCTTVPGDTLFSLAEKHKIPPPMLKIANPGISFEPLLPGTQLVIPGGHSVVYEDVPYTSDVLRYNLLGLKARYPFLKFRSIGRSVLDKHIYQIQVGRGRHRVTYNAAHHANEWITTPMLMKFVETLCHAAVTGERVAGYSVQNALEKHTYDIIPMVNPDGVDLVTGNIDPESQFYQFAQRRCKETTTPFPQGWKANAHGVDLNLNYPANWEKAKQIKHAAGYCKPGPHDFVGTRPLSEPESAAMAAFTRRHGMCAPDCYRLAAAWHTQGRVIYWKFDRYNPPLSELIGKLFSTLSGYAMEVTPAFSANAGYRDWFIQTFNKPGYTIEAGEGESPLPLSDLSRIYEENIGIMLLGGLV